MLAVRSKTNLRVTLIQTLAVTHIFRNIQSKLVYLGNPLLRPTQPHSTHFVAGWRIIFLGNKHLITTMSCVFLKFHRAPWYTLKLGMESEYGIGIATLKLGMENGIQNRNTKTRNGMEFPEHLKIVLSGQYMI